MPVNYLPGRQAERQVFAPVFILCLFLHVFAAEMEVVSFVNALRQGHGWVRMPTVSAAVSPDPRCVRVINPHAFVAG